MLRRLLLLPLAISLLVACSGGDDDPEVLGASVERSTTTTTEADDPSSSTTSTGPTTTSTTTGAPTTTATPTTAPRAPATTSTTAEPAPTTTAPTAPTEQTVSGRYVSPDGDGDIHVDLLDGNGKVLATQPMGPSGGDFAFAVDPGTYRLQITDVGTGTSEHRTSAKVVTRTESFTLEAGRSARFECHVRTGCAGTVR